MALDPLDPVYLGTLAGVWVTLLLLTVVLGIIGRRLAHHSRLPLDAPAPLDTYGIACLVGGPSRLREAALAVVEVRRMMPVTELTATGRPESDLVTNRLTGPGRLSVATEVVHPVEEAMRFAVEGPTTRDPAGVDTAKHLAAGYQPELERLDLLANPVRAWWIAPAGVCGVLLIALSILSIIVAAKSKQGREGPGKNTPPGVDVVIVASAFALFGSFAALGCVFPTRSLNRRGERMLALAREQNAHLIPAGRHWSCLRPCDLALSIALFGLDGWAAWPPLAQLYARLHPPGQPDGGG